MSNKKKKRKKYPRKIKIGKHYYDLGSAEAERDLRQQLKAHKTKKYWGLW